MSNSRRSIDKGLMRLDAAREELEREQAALDKLDERKAALGEARIVIQSIAREIQQKTFGRISEIVSTCLAAVFDEPYEFRFDFVEKRGRTEAQMTLLRGDLEVSPMGSVGGGVLDVAAFALRVASIVFAKPARRRLLVLDEPFRFLSEEYRERVRVLLEQMAEELDFQFVMVTHIPEIVTGKVIRLG